MTVAARLRVLLAILALLLVPVWAPAQSAVAMTAMDMTMAMPAAPSAMAVDCDHHTCDHGGVPAAHHADAACALGCLQASLPPLLLSASLGVRPLAPPSRLAPPAVTTLPSRHPSPPERPPRA